MDYSYNIILPDASISSLCSKRSVILIDALLADEMIHVAVKVSPLIICI